MDPLIPVALLLLLLGYSAVAHSDDRGWQLWKEVIDKAVECATDKAGSEFYTCYINATPKKCQPYVIDYISGGKTEEAKRAWCLCVASCANVGFWSEHFGECSRQLK
jgi:hypothetical protein